MSVLRYDLSEARRRHPVGLDSDKGFPDNRKLNSELIVAVLEVMCSPAKVIIGVYFFEYDGLNVTVNGSYYLDMLNDSFTRSVFRSYATTV